MRRHWTTRLIGALLAFWFPLSVGEPAIAHACPMHGTGMFASAAMPMSHGGAMAHAMAHEAQPGHEHAPAPSNHHCTCISCCAGASAVALAPSAPAVAPVATRIVAAAAFPSAESLPRPGPPHARPWSTGPPRA